MLRIAAMSQADLPEVRRIWAEGIATGEATFETTVPDDPALADRWVPGQRWVARLERGGGLAGWAAASATSARPCYAGVLETSVYVGEDTRGRGVGRALVRHQVEAAEAAGFWTLQTAVLSENRASIALHEAEGFRVVGVREAVARLHGRWRDTVLMERRSSVVGR